MLPREERRKLDRRFNKAKQGGKVKTIKIQPLRSLTGEKFQRPDDNGRMEEKTLQEILSLILFQIPVQTLALEDSVKAQNYFLEVGKQKVNGFLKLEDESYRWMHEKVTKFGHLTVGLNIIKIKEAIENLVEEKEKVV